MGASSIGVAVLLNKIHNRKVKFHCDNYFCELECADEYVFGFGLDYNKHFRNCDSLYFLKQ